MTETLDKLVPIEVAYAELTAQIENLKQEIVQAHVEVTPNLGQFELVTDEFIETFIAACRRSDNEKIDYRAKWRILDLSIISVITALGVLADVQAVGPIVRTSLSNYYQTLLLASTYLGTVK